MQNEIEKESVINRRINFLLNSRCPILLGSGDCEKRGNREIGEFRSFGCSSDAQMSLRPKQVMRISPRDHLDVSGDGDPANVANNDA
jgi:hypothetical protein